MKKNIILKMLIIFSAITIIGINPTFAESAEAKELQKEYTKKGAAAADEFSSTFKAVDKNNDGILSKEELENTGAKAINILAKMNQVAASFGPAQYKLYRDNATRINAEYNRRREAAGLPVDNDTTAGTITERIEKETSVYQNPQLDTSGRTAAGSLNDMISDADSFANQGQIQYNEGALQSFSSVMFNIFSIVGAAIALIVGIIIGIKYMMGSIEEKANYKQMLVPYLVGCFVVFSAFGIWKLVITILEEV